MGEATTAFQNHYGYFWSRRRQSTSVNGVCQARTTTSGILLGERGSRVIITGFCLCRITETPANRGPERCRGRREGCVERFAPARSVGTVQCYLTRLRRRGWGNKARRWCSFGGRVWELWRTGTGANAGRGGRKMVQPGDFDAVKFCTARVGLCGWSRRFGARLRSLCGAGQSLMGSRFPVVVSEAEVGRPK